MPADDDHSGLRSRAQPVADAVPEGAAAAAETAAAGAPPEASPDEGSSKPRKTYGRIPSTGQIFVVPQTHDMVSTLLSPTQPKNLSDLVILAVLAVHIGLFFVLPASVRTPTFLVLFMFWRASYNAGIGWLLEIQSKYGQLVHWAKKYGIFDKERRPTVYKFVRRELESKIAEEVKNGDYVFDEAPIEYNTWLVFRRVVDLILMNDFVSYVLMAMSCAHIPDGEGWGLTAGRWAGGIVLFLFNLWVKLDAHRVVKDYAWYWGDFFYLIDQNLTFDGVYEIAPHPMYSVGYAGYYGISLMAASYTVLWASLIAHAAQFAFLSKVENPHIEKTYNPPAPRRKSGLASTNVSTENLNLNVDGSNGSAVDDYTPTERSLLQPPDLLNSTHFSTTLLLFYVFMLAILTPNTRTIQTLFIINAVLWRFWHTVGIGAILVGQSQNKLWVRHFLKVGETLEDAWRQWKGIYYVSLCMCHASFIAAAWKLYNFPTGNERMVVFRHVVGVMLIMLQAWTGVSIYDSLGEFGWFYGDFFFDRPRQLTYSGIYRYLNNPERLIGCAGIWGIVLIASSPAIFLIGLFAHVCSLLFINLVERPHMQKLYGTQLRREAGVARTIRRAIPPPVANQVRFFQGSIDKVVAEASDFVEELLENARPHRIPRAVSRVVKDTQALLANYPARLSITLLADDLANYDREKYSLTLLNAVNEHGSEPGAKKSPTVPYGEPIRVRFTAPRNHAPKDWIGLYRVADNASRKVTRIASMGRWVAVCRDQYETKTPDIGNVTPSHPATTEAGAEICEGEVVFAGPKAFWRNGVYELRYHHDGKHNVMALSPPFEIAVGKADGGESEEAVERLLLPVVQRCFDNDPEIAPADADEGFGALGEETYAKRVVYAVRHMFGVDFTPEVVKADGNVKRLSWRICNARRVLAPFSMNATKTTATPASPQQSPPATPRPEKVAIATAG